MASAHTAMHSSHMYMPLGPSIMEIAWSLGLPQKAHLISLPSMYVLSLLIGSLSLRFRLGGSTLRFVR